MSPARRPQVVAGAIVAMALIAVPALAGNPSVTTGAFAPTASADVDVSAGSATLTATVPGPTLAGAVYFEWGAGQSFKQTTESVAIIAGSDPTSVSTTVTGLMPGPVYRYRAVEVTATGTVTSAIGSFTLVTPTTTTPATATTDTTSGPATAVSTIPASGTPKSGSSKPPSSHGGGSQGGSGQNGSNSSGAPGDETPKPQIGKSVVVEPATGTVKIQMPGSVAKPLASETAIPVGSTIDATKGSVDLTAVRSTGKLNTATFWGGRFIVRHPKGHPGMTELVLRDRPSCPSARSARAARRRHPSVELWGHDNHGRFQTRGRNSVATVRGTTWYMADTCAGTVTGVLSGTVAVRDVHTGHVTVLHATPPPPPTP